MLLSFVGLAVLVGLIIVGVYWLVKNVTFKKDNNVK
jgi:hypothetical protein